MIIKIDLKKCIGCGLCEDYCPTDVIRIDKQLKKAKIVYFDDCMTCYNCEIYCPVKAVKVHPFKKEQPQVW
ncbi:MAG: 4Fe-4S dicluster domain-containing protein [Candidatus Helarchaeota archaeon]